MLVQGQVSKANGSLAIHGTRLNLGLKPISVKYLIPICINWMNFPVGLQESILSPQVSTSNIYAVIDYSTFEVGASSIHPAIDYNCFNIVVYLE